MNQALSLTTFLEKFKQDRSMLLHAPVTFFKAKQYPLLFFSLLMQELRKQGDISLLVLDLKMMSKHDVQRTIENSFFGQSSLFWLGSLSDLSAAEQQFWYDYCMKYQGPNNLFVCVDEQASPTGCTVIELQSPMMFETIIALGTTFTATDLQRLRLFFKKVISITGELTLDQACLFLSYCSVAGAQADIFYQELVPLLASPQVSLFALSDALFENKSILFLELWQTLKESYGVPFWISFWSEQMWRGYWYVVLMRSGKSADAKKISYRLPYSFTQKSWKKYAPESLMRAHDFLYTADFNLKNGLVSENDSALDLFCTQFMANRF